MEKSNFFDNPLVASIGNVLGVGPVLRAASDAGAAPDAAPPETQAPKPGASPVNQPMYKNRPYIPPFSHAQTVNGGVRPGGTLGVPGEQMDPSVLQNPQIQDLLGQFGISASNTHPDSHLFIHNPEAFTKHPVIANAIERGLGSLAAYQGTGADTAETIGNVARSVLGADAMRTAHYNAGVMAPFQQAAQVAGLQKSVLDQENVRSEIENRKQLQEHYERQEDNKAAYESQLIDYKNAAIDAKRTAEQAKLDPEMHGKQVYYTNALNALTKQYGSEDAIPASEIAKVNTGWESSKDYANGQRVVEAARINANARTAAAGISAGASNYRVDHTKVGDTVYKGMQQKQRDVASQLRSMQSAQAGKIMTIGGKRVIKGSAAWDQAVTAMQQQHDSLQNKMDQYVGLPTADAAPPAAAPAAQSSAHIPTWDPVTRTVH